MDNFTYILCTGSNVNENFVKTNSEGFILTSFNGTHLCHRSPGVPGPVLEAIQFLHLKLEDKRRIKTWSNTVTGLPD